MNLLYITFGNNAAIHFQAAFSIYSFLGYKESISNIHIITDAPDYYNHLQEFVKITVVSEETLQEWKGPHDFFWRIKIKAIEQIAKEYTGQPIIYLDTDTCLYENLDCILQALNQEKAVMYKDEGLLSQASSKTEKLMWRQIKEATFAGILMHGTHMWNAGVVGIPNTKNGFECELALRICDEMCAQNVTRRLVEQLALSIALNHVYGLFPATGSIAHYWSTKDEWNQTISNFFAAIYCKGLNTQEIISLIHQFDFSSIPIQKKVSKTAERLNNLVNKVFKETRIQHISKNQEE